MGDGPNIRVVVDATERGGGAKVLASAPSTRRGPPRCIRAVRLSDAFCFRITMMPSSSWWWWWWW